MDESKFISDGERLGLEESKLIQYIDQCRDRETKRIEDDFRRLEQEEKKRDAEVKLKLQHEENDAKRIERDMAMATNGNTPQPHNESKNIIDLAQFRDNDDISIYLRNFERVLDANGLSEAATVSALINGFIGSKVSIFIVCLILHMVS